VNRFPVAVSPPCSEDVLNPRNGEIEFHEPGKIFVAVVVLAWVTARLSLGFVRFVQQTWVDFRRLCNVQLVSVTNN
jgi:hypothetical protein